MGVYGTVSYAVSSEPRRDRNPRAAGRKLSSGSPRGEDRSNARLAFRLEHPRSSRFQPEALKFQPQVLSMSIWPTRSGSDSTTRSGSGSDGTVLIQYAER